MDVEDRRGADLQEPLGGVQGPLGQQVVGLALRYGEHHRVRLQRLAGYLDAPTAVHVPGDGGDTGTDLGADARGVERLAGQPVVQFAERDVRPADVGRARVGQQTGLEHHRGEPQGGVARDRVEGGDPDQVPQGLDGTLRLTVRGQPAAEVLRVQRRIGEVEPLERERGPAHLGAVGERQVRVGGEAAPQMQGHGQRVAPQPAEPASLGPRGVQDGYVEPVLQRSQRRALDAVEEPAVGGAAAQVHMLSVVDGQLAALEGEGQSAESRPALEQGDAHSGVGERERGGDAGEPAAHHDGVPPVRDRSLGPRAVGHRAPSSARRPCAESGAGPAVSVWDATTRRRVAHRLSPTVWRRGVSSPRRAATTRAEPPSPAPTTGRRAPSSPRRAATTPAEPPGPVPTTVTRPRQRGEGAGRATRHALGARAVMAPVVSGPSWAARQARRSRAGAPVDAARQACASSPAASSWPRSLVTHAS